MIKSKYGGAVCIAIVVAMLVVTCAFMGGASLGLVAAHNEPAYVRRLFTTDKVHTIDIIVDESDWEEMIENASAEEYIQASVVIDGDSVKGVGLRPKGNSSLSMIRSADSDRYSFKVEFDHFSNGTNYYGLDKLVLNNIAQDSTYMKDYVSYQMMNDMGADAPLSSFIWVTVNGEDWGLYLAAEAIEESFANRVYGNDYGEIYKPDTMDLNNRENWGGNGDGNEGGEIPDFGNSEMPDFGNMPGSPNGEMPTRDEGNMPATPDGAMPNWGGADRQQGGEENPDVTTDDNSQRRGNRGGFGGGMGGMFGGSSSAVALTYSDDDPDSYSAIFDNAAFKVSEADKTRLIASLKQLNEGENIDEVVNVDEVMRYFAVHNFVLNSDSYTGNMIHNYYLYEEDGKLSMIAWDYNLAFGGMGGMGGGMRGFGNTETTTTDTATTYVNYPIDDPMLSGSTEDKPMIAWIFSDEEYLAQYHEVLADYMEYFSSGAFAEMYDEASRLISPYVEKDPTAFCTYEDFATGLSELREFCLLRAESISKQLDGAIASTSEGQTETAHANFVDASGVDMNSMGSSNMGFGGARGGNMRNRNSGDNSDSENEGATNTSTGNGVVQTRNNRVTGSSDGNNDSSLPVDIPDGFAPPDGERDFTPPDGMPEGITSSEVEGGIMPPNRRNGNANVTDNSSRSSTQTSEDGPLLGVSAAPNKPCVKSFRPLT
jgi:spore coat protein CotH